MAILRPTTENIVKILCRKYCPGPGLNNLHSERGDCAFRGGRLGAGRLEFQETEADSSEMQKQIRMSLLAMADPDYDQGDLSGQASSVHRQIVFFI